MQNPLRTIFIFGDSFCIRSRLSWVDILINNYNLRVYNASKGGARCSYMLDAFKKNLKRIKKDDFVIICWSDKNREHLNVANPKWQEIIDNKYQNTLIEAKQLLETNNINHVIIWGFPSDYGIKSSWLSTEFLYTDKNSYKYSMEFANEIKPALIYFSRQELQHIKDENILSKLMADDTRPNHIANPEIHRQLADAILKFYNKEITGQVYLKDS